MIAVIPVLPRHLGLRASIGSKGDLIKRSPTSILWRNSTCAAPAEYAKFALFPAVRSALVQQFVQREEPPSPF